MGLLEKAAQVPCPLGHARPNFELFTACHVASTLGLVDTKAK